MVIGRREQARVAARVRELMGEPPADGEARHATAARWEPSRAAVIALGVLLVVVVAATAWWYFGTQAPAVPVTASGAGSPAFSASSSPSSLPSASAPSASSPTATSSAGSIVVDVAGKVRHPGVYRLAAGSRVDDAVRAAGGPRRGVSTVTINLAAPLHDGDQVVVGEPATAAGGTGAGATPTSAVVDLNTATAEQLDALPGVGPVLAQHIVDWRSAHGGFTSVDQLQNVSGIGDAKFADLRPLVSV